MRPPKFRVWDNDHKKFFEPVFDASNGKLEELLIQPNGRLLLREIDGVIGESLFPNRFILMQYTGLKDKNGKEIYESDILIPATYKKAHWFPCVVVFYKGMFCLDLSRPFIATRSPLYKTIDRGKKAKNEFEIIGTVHENPELLK